MHQGLRTVAVVGRPYLGSRTRAVDARFAELVDADADTRTTDLAAHAPRTVDRGSTELTDRLVHGVRLLAATPNHPGALR